VKQPESPVSKSHRPLWQYSDRGFFDYLLLIYRFQLKSAFLLGLIIPGRSAQ